MPSHLMPSVDQVQSVAKMLFGNDAAVDWVLIELRSADRETRIAAKAALLQRLKPQEQSDLF